MKIIIEDPQDLEEDQIIIKCRQMTPELLHMIALLKMRDGLTAYDGNKIKRIPLADIYYIEVVDNKTFIYSKDKLYESKQKLYELEKYLENTDLLRISKSVIVNLSKIGSLVPALNGRFEVVLVNEEKLIISRQYVSGLKKRLGL